MIAAISIELFWGISNIIRRSHRGISDENAPVGLSKRGRDTESDANIQPEECSHFSPTNIPSAFPHEIPTCILIILLIKTVKDNKQDDVSKELDT